VSPPVLGEHLAEHRNVTVMLRLVVDSDGHLVHGELVDLDGSTHGRFLTWERMVELLSVHIADTSA
jgi:hypothetical protein